MAGASLALAHGNNDDNDDHDRSRLTVCERSANKILRSCRNEIEEEYFAETARCINLGDAGEREECFDEVRQARRENRELCGAQREARSNVCDLLMEDRYDPEAFLSPDNFARNPGVEDAANPYFSLTPGHTYVALAGEGFEETIVVTVTEELREVLMEEDAIGVPVQGTGVNCCLVVDIVLVDGEPVEITDDYYALALNGDVHYCGEVARNFEGGILVDLDGSFEAGRDRAKSAYSSRRSRSCMTPIARNFCWVKPRTLSGSLLARQRRLPSVQVKAARTCATRTVDSSARIDA